MFKRVNSFLIFVMVIFLSLGVVVASEDVSNVTVDSMGDDILSTSFSDESDVVVPVSDLVEYNVSSSNYGDYFSEEGNLIEGNVQDGDTIILNGVFNNNKFIFNTALNIVGADDVIINGGSIVLLEGASGSNVSNLVIKNIDIGDMCGICLDGADYCNIFNNDIHCQGVSSFPISLNPGSDYNNIYGNSLKSSATSTPSGLKTSSAFVIGASHHNYIADNYVEVDDANGIYLSQYGSGSFIGGPCNNNVIFNNIVKCAVFPTSWNYGIQMMGNNNKAISNTVIGCYRGISGAGTNTVVTDNTLTDLTGINFANGQLEGGDYAIIVGSGSNVTGNIIKNCFVDTGIQVGSNSIVENNVVEVIEDGSGIEADGDNINVIGNNISTVNGHAVYQRGQYTGLSVVNNRIVSNSGCGIFATKQSSSKFPSNVEITGNDINTANEYAINIENVDKDSYVVSDNNVGESKILTPDGEIIPVPSKVNVTINLDINNVIYGEAVVISGTVSQGATGNITININGTNHTVDLVDGAFELVVEDLDAGLYSLTASYNGDENHTNANIDPVNFEIYKSNATLDVNIENINNGQTIIVTGTFYGILTDTVSGNVSIKLNNSIQNVKIINNQFIYEFVDIDLPVGNYNLDIIYSGDNNYNSLSESYIFNVDLISTVLNIDLDKESYIYGESVVVSGTLTTNDGNPVTGMVDIIVDGRSYQSQVINGEFRLNVPNLDAGSYTVNVRFNGDVTYAMSSDSVRFSVSKANPTLNVDVDDIVLGEDAVIHITLGGIDSSLEGNVEVTVDSIIENVQVIGGEGVLVVSNLSAGNFIVSVVYDGSSNYNPISASDSFRVSDKVIDITVDVSEVVVNDNETKILGDISDSEGNVLNGNLTIELGNETVTVDVNDGEFEAIIPEVIPSGEYEVTVVFEGEDESYANTIIVITVPAGDEIIAENLVMYYNNGSQFTAQIIVDGMPQANANVSITINGVSYNRISDDDGYVSMNINLSPGIYDISVSYEDLSVNCTVSVLSTLESSDLVKYYKNASQYEILVLDGHGNPLANSTVEFNINGVFYERVTNSEGIATLNINLNPGTYIITAIGPDGLMSSNNVTVLSTIAADDVVKYHLNDTQYMIEVVDGQGNPLANKSVIININGVFYNRTTDENGIAVLNINLSPGDYVATVYDLESGLSVSNNIKVLSVLSGDDLEMFYHDGSRYDAKLVDSHGNPLEGETITFNINGVFYNKITDVNGVAFLDINLNPGDYIITAYWGEIAHSNIISVKQN